MEETEIRYSPDHEPSRVVPAIVILTLLTVLATSAVAHNKPTERASPLPKDRSGETTPKCPEGFGFGADYGENGICIRWIPSETGPAGVEIAQPLN